MGLSFKNKNYFSPMDLVLILFLVFGLSFLSLVLFEVPKKSLGVGISALKGKINRINSTQSGTILKWHAKEGQELESGSLLVSIRQKKTGEVFIMKSAKKEFLAEIINFASSKVKEGDALALTMPLADKKKDLEIIGFVSSKSGKDISVGDEVNIFPSTHPQNLHGYLLGRVKSAGSLPLSEAGVASLIKIPGLAQSFREKLGEEPFLVRIELEKDEKHLSGYDWSKNYNQKEFDFGVLVNFEIVTEKRSLFKIIFPKIASRFCR